MNIKNKKQPNQQTIEEYSDELLMSIINDYTNDNKFDFLKFLSFAFINSSTQMIKKLEKMESENNKKTSD